MKVWKVNIETINEFIRTQHNDNNSEVLSHLSKLVYEYDAKSAQELSLSVLKLLVTSALKYSLMPPSLSIDKSQQNNEAVTVQKALFYFSDMFSLIHKSYPDTRYIHILKNINSLTIAQLLNVKTINKVFTHPTPLLIIDLGLLISDNSPLVKSKEDIFDLIFNVDGLQPLMGFYAICKGISSRALHSQTPEATKLPPFKLSQKLKELLETNSRLSVLSHIMSVFAYNFNDVCNKLEQLLSSHNQYLLSPESEEEFWTTFLPYGKYKLTESVLDELLRSTGSRWERFHSLTLLPESSNQIQKVYLEGIKMIKEPHDIKTNKPQKYIISPYDSINDTKQIDKSSINKFFDNIQELPQFIHSIGFDFVYGSGSLLLSHKDLGLNIKKVVAAIPDRVRIIDFTGIHLHYATNKERNDLKSLNFVEVAILTPAIIKTLSSDFFKKLLPNIRHVILDVKSYDLHNNSIIMSKSYQKDQSKAKIKINKHARLLLDHAKANREPRLTELYLGAGLKKFNLCPEMVREVGKQYQFFSSKSSKRSQALLDAGQTLIERADENSKENKNNYVPT